MNAINTNTSASFTSVAQAAVVANNAAWALAWATVSPGFLFMKADKVRAVIDAGIKAGLAVDSVESDVGGWRYQPGMDDVYCCAKETVAQALS